MLGGCRKRYPRVGIAMEADATADFTLFSTTRVNQAVTFFACGEQIESVSVSAPIDSGCAVSDPLSPGRAADVAAALIGESDCL